MIESKAIYVCSRGFLDDRTGVLAFTPQRGGGLYHVTDHDGRVAGSVGVVGGADVVVVNAEQLTPEQTKKLDALAIDDGLAFAVRDFDGWWQLGEGANCGNLTLCTRRPGQLGSAAFELRTGSRSLYASPALVKQLNLAPGWARLWPKAAA